MYKRQAYGLIVFYRRRAEAEGRDPLSATPITGFTTSIDPPAWWIEESKRRLQPALLSRVLLRAAMGLWGPPNATDSFVSPLVPRDDLWFQGVMLGEILERRQGTDYSAPLPDPGDIKPFLTRLAGEQRQEGQRRTLRYLVTEPDGSLDSPVLMRRGNRSFVVGEMDVYAGPQPHATFQTGPRNEVLDETLRILGWPAEEVLEIPIIPQSTQPILPTLELLRMTSVLFGSLLGVDPGEVTAWVLCDHELVSPWIDIHIAPVGAARGTAAGLRMVLDVGSLSVTPDALARAYGGFRTGMLTAYGEDSLPKPPDDWDVRRRQFMAEWRSQHTRAEWEAAWAEWQSRHPDSKWRKFRSFRNADYAVKGAKP